MGSEAIGWFSSCVLLLTIGRQVYTQWKSGSSKGVSRWLFVGQLTASTGFTLYSVLVHNWVFVVKHRRAERRNAGRAPSRASPVRA